MGSQWQVQQEEGEAPNYSNGAGRGVAWDRGRALSENQGLSAIRCLNLVKNKDMHLGWETEKEDPVSPTGIISALRFLFHERPVPWGRCHSIY